MLEFQTQGNYANDLWQLHAEMEIQRISQQIFNNRLIALVLILLSICLIKYLRK